MLLLGSIPLMLMFLNQGVCWSYKLKTNNSTSSRSSFLEFLRSGDVAALFSIRITSQCFTSYKEDLWSKIKLYLNWLDGSNRTGLSVSTITCPAYNATTGSYNNFDLIVSHWTTFTFSKDLNELINLSSIHQLYVANPVLD